VVPSGGPILLQINLACPWRSFSVRRWRSARRGRRRIGSLVVKVARAASILPAAWRAIVTSPVRR